MRHSIASRFLLAILITVSGSPGCASTNVDAADRGLTEPVVTVRQPTGQVLALPGQSANVNLQIDVYNPGAESITVKRISLSTLPTADIQFAPASRNVDEIIAPRSSKTIELWVRATSESGRSEATSPQQVRGTVVFDSASGHFRKIFIERVVESAGNRPGDR